MKFKSERDPKRTWSLKGTEFEVPVHDGLGDSRCRSAKGLYAFRRVEQWLKLEIDVEYKRYKHFFRTISKMFAH